MSKILYAFSVATLAILIGGGIPVFARTATPSNVSSIASEVAFNLKIPSHVILSEDVNGGYSGNYYIYANNTGHILEVYPSASSFELSSVGKESVTAYVEQDITIFDDLIDEAEGKVYVNEDISAGKWEGSFSFTVIQTEPDEVYLINDLATPSDAEMGEQDIESEIGNEVIESEIETKENLEESTSNEHESILPGTEETKENDSDESIVPLWEESKEESTLNEEGRMSG